jgi:hypothetical protein
LSDAIGRKKNGIFLGKEAGRYFSNLFNKIE